MQIDFKFFVNRFLTFSWTSLCRIWRNLKSNIGNPRSSQIQKLKGCRSIFFLNWYYHFRDQLFKNKMSRGSPQYYILMKLETFFIPNSLFEYTYLYNDGHNGWCLGYWCLLCRLDTNHYGHHCIWVNTTPYLNPNWFYTCRSSLVLV